MSSDLNVKASRRTIHAHLTLILQITLVGDNDDRELIHILNSENLLVEGTDLLERVPRSDGIDEQETFTRPHVLLAHGTEKLQVR